MIDKINKNTPRSNKEDILEVNIARYIKIAYKGVVFHFDSGAGRKTSMTQAKRHKMLHGNYSRGYPDLFIAKPNKYYHGMYIELKAEGKSPYLKDGKTLRKDEHLKIQAQRHQELRDAGYWCEFCTGFNEAMEAIDNYMENVQ